MFHVGQKVRFIVNGSGTIEEVEAGVNYSVKFQLDGGGIVFCTADGRLWEHQDVVLFPADSNAFLQDLKQLLQRYNASIEACLYPDNGVIVLEVISDGQAVTAVYDKLNSENILP